MTEERRQQIAKVFPNLEADYVPSSCESEDYNCIAWSFNDTSQWWWPTRGYGIFWPEEVPLDNERDTVIRMFEIHGYVRCEGGKREDGYEKVAIYERQGSGVQHVARQLRDGYWTSKLGDWEDIRHRTVKSVECEDYGTVEHYLKRRRPDWGTVMEDDQGNPRNSKPISLHPLKPEDAIRAALMTPPPLREKKRKRKKVKKMS